jgi:prepilin-type processing-associated H-X9-DG protein/prepilin-type N-terminal cleavage/methylation domain-containing protein
MKRLSLRKAVEAFTLMELLLVVAVVAILAALFLPAFSGRPSRPYTVMCMSNLKMLGLGLQMFADDNNGLFPAQLSVTNGGSLELASSNSAALHFRTLTNYVAREMRVFRCPADQTKVPPATNSALTDSNLSYFISLDAVRGMTNVMQAGDRNLEMAGRPVKPGLVVLVTNVAVDWTAEIHYIRAGRARGNILFGDGHVQTLLGGLPMATAVQRQDLATNRLAVP